MSKQLKLRGLVLKKRVWVSIISIIVSIMFIGVAFQAGRQGGKLTSQGDEDKKALTFDMTPLAQDIKTPGVGKITITVINHTGELITKDYLKHSNKAFAQGLPDPGYTIPVIIDGRIARAILPFEPGSSVISNVEPEDKFDTIEKHSIKSKTIYLKPKEVFKATVTIKCAEVDGRNHLYGRGFLTVVDEFGEQRLYLLDDDEVYYDCI